MTQSKSCPNCESTLESGFVPTSKGGAGLFQASWHPGPADSDKSFWEKAMSGPGVKVDQDKLVPIHAYRCPKCYQVLFFAPPR